MSREANVKIEVEYVDNNPAIVWLTNLVTGRREDVPVEDAAPFLEFLLGMAIEVGEDAGRPWRQPANAQVQESR